VSFFSAAERFAALDHSAVTLDKERCLHSKDQFSDCEACFGVCPVSAVNPGKPPGLDLEKCENCLACLPVCPVGAFHADDAVASLLNCAARVESGTIELLCGIHPHPEIGAANGVGIRVNGCLAGLGRGAYLLLASLGVEKVIVRTDACKTCQWTDLRTHVESQVSQSRMFLAAWGKTKSVICMSDTEAMVERPVWESTNPPLSRRDLFRMMARQGQIAIARAAENGHVRSEKQAGRDRLRMLSAVRNLPTEHALIPFALKDFNFATLTVSGDCTACGVCANTCPTRALRFEINEGDKNFILTFSAPDCIGCDLCAHVCAPAAINIDHAPMFDQVFSKEIPVVARTSTLVRCDHCNTLMAARPGVRLCPLCEYRRKNPFGSGLPPGMKVPERLTNKKRV
jgi:ferredoxin